VLEGKHLPGDLRSPYGEAPDKVFFTSAWNLAMFVAEVVTLVLAVSDPGHGYVRPWSRPCQTLVMAMSDPGHGPVKTLVLAIAQFILYT